MILGYAPGWPVALSVATDATPVLVGRTAGGFTGWNLTTGAVLSTFGGEHFGPNCLAVTRVPDGRLIAVAGSDFEIGRWDVRTGEPLDHADRFEPHQYLSVAAHGRLIAAAPVSPDVVHCRDVLTGESWGHLGPHAGHAGLVTDVLLTGPLRVETFTAAG